MLLTWSLWSVCLILAWRCLEKLFCVCHRRARSRDESTFEEVVPTLAAIDKTFDRSLPAKPLRDCPLSKAILRAVDAGRMIEAHRQLYHLEMSGMSPEEFIDAQSLDQIRCVGDHYQSSTSVLQMESSGGWIKEKLSADVEFGYRIANGEIHLVSSTDCENYDILKALAALCEVDLCKGYKPNVSRAESVGDARRGIESIWRIYQRGMMSGKLEDNIAQVSVVDALDENLGALWVSVRAPQHQGISELSGVRIPAPQTGMNRCYYGTSTFCLTPKDIWSGRQGFRMTMAVCGPAPRATLVMPTFALKALMRKGAKDMVGSFLEHLETCTELEQRIHTSPRKHFYSMVTRRLTRELAAQKLACTVAASVAPMNSCSTCSEASSNELDNHDDSTTSSVICDQLEEFDSLKQTSWMECSDTGLRHSGVRHRSILADIADALQCSCCFACRT